MTSIDNFSNYLIYNNGDVYSKKREIFLKPRYDKTGYARYDMRSDDKQTHTKKAHQLVCIAYLGLIPEYKTKSILVIDHIDNNKTNNYLHNLQIITREQNLRRINKEKKTGLSKGVVYSGNKFKASITINKQKINLGKYDTELEAYVAYKKAIEPLMKNVIL